MSAAAIALALFAALLHASWNAFLRTGTDRLRTMTVMALSGMAVALPLVLWLPFPPAAAWPYLLLSSCLQLGYGLFLIRAYAQGELGQVYPVVRGSVPLLVTLGGFALGGERPDLVQTAGTVLVAAGIMSLALGRPRASAASILYALATGLFIAGYATIDSIGVRQGAGPGAYAAWILLLYGGLLLAVFLAVRGKFTLDLRAPETRKALAGGVFALAAYGAVIAAFAIGPAGPITALRETSVVFAALIGRVFLNETLSRRRIAACLVVALGAVCLG